MKRLSRTIILLVLLLLIIVSVCAFYFIYKYTEPSPPIKDSCNISSAEQENSNDAFDIFAYIHLEEEYPTVNAIYEQISNMDNVKSARLETREEAFENFKKALGEDADVLDGLSPEFLRFCVKIVLFNDKDIDRTVNRISDINRIANVVKSPF